MIRRDAGAAPKVSAPGAALSPARQRLRESLSLPTQKSVPSQEIGDYTCLIYGEKKIGKTSLAARFPEALFVMFEPGGKALEIYQVPCNTWLEFLTYLDMLEEETQRFKTIVIDTVDNAYTMCFRYVCEREGFKHPSDAGYGKGWDAIKSEFAGAITRLLKLGRGVIFLSHAKEEEYELPDGGTIQKIVPSLANAGKEILKAPVDNILYYGYVGSERRMILRGNEYLNAGVRCERNFRTPSGEEIYSISMGKTADEAYANFVAAFANQLDDTGLVRSKLAIGEKKAKWGAK